ncbi:hypothetical protein EV385_0522 [Krasilnikovia cinnamomea]|uniref:Uncharacterized protein n=1 Tax=Krasilnikovia cinnamomea TaxID=349313 RepID=A0A4Q7ZDS4_9ACTN|nr:hypothetical protein [Krasilnikovia cinnamomea]RZU48798.1 hypothetical protein EV385_0522 [Krasilnikovia cinnamomea]
MKARWTHGRSTRHPEAVCGADDGPDTRVTDEPHLVNCPDCPDAAENETIPDDAADGDPHVIAMLREAKAGNARKIGGVFVDATTANAILTVYDAATPKTQVKIAALPITIMASFAWRVIGGGS